MGNQPTRGSKKYLCEINILHRERAGPDGGVSPQGALVEPGQHVARRAVICGFYQPHRVGKVYTGFLDRKKVFLFYTGPLIERKHVNFTKVFLFYTDPLIERKYVNFIKVFLFYTGPLIERKYVNFIKVFRFPRMGRVFRSIKFIFILHGSFDRKKVFRFYKSF